jgi:hypothetical protein
MDDGPVALVQSRAGVTGREVDDVQQYQNIVKFRDAVLAGKHPTVKLPPGVSPSGSPHRPKSIATLANGQTPIAHNARSVSANQAIFSDAPSASPLDTPASRPIEPSHNGINPIFLEKSDELIRAEFQLQRQRLERALKDEVEQRQRRGSRTERAEPLADFDLSDVLSRALTLVQATTAPTPVDTNLTATNEAASDSFDNNTFYSSRHDTPDSRLAALVQDESDDGGEYEPSEFQPVIEPYVAQSIAVEANSSSQNIPITKPQEVYSAARTADTHLGGAIQVPGLNNYPNGQPAFVSHREPNGPQSISDDSGQMEHPNTIRDARQQMDDVYIDTHPPSPLVQNRSNHALEMAPQPNQASQSVVEEPFPFSVNSGLSTGGGAPPAQVAALRNQQSAITSPDSSPQAGKGSVKRKSKKKKRKLDRQAPEEVMPYIKPEPRSPSPVTAPVYPRPSKRQKQAQRLGQDIEADDLTVINRSQPSQEAYDPRFARGGPAPAGYGNASSFTPRSATTAGLADQRYGREFFDDRRPPPGVYARPQPSSPVFAAPPPPSMAYSSRPIVVDDEFTEQRRVFREPQEASRMSMRPESELYGPPRPPARILVDSFGREYIEPPRPVLRQSVAPTAHHGEPEIIYERVMPRAASRQPGPPAYDDGAALYQRAPSAYPMPRRVVTQPEYMPHEYNDGRPREYSTRPAGPATEYVRVMAPPERIPADIHGREYAPRAVSARPVEHIRYEIPHEQGRMQSVRPEGPGREYAGPAHNERRHEVVQPYVMDYGSRPADPPIQRGYSVRPVERYYDSPQARGENVTYIERPAGATREIVYADNPVREVYR